MDDSDLEFEKHLDWYRKNLKIRTKQAEIIPFELNKIQRALEKYKWECWEQDSPCLVVILKARQEGVSTWAEATLFRDSREFDHRESVVMAHKEDASRHIFEMTKRFYDLLPEPKPETEKSSARALRFKDTGSEFKVETAGAGSGAGRSMTFQGAHFSELDFYQDPEEVLGALMQTIPDRGRVVVIIESTANGPMLTMNDLWDRSVEGRSGFKPFFFPWFVHEEYSRPLTWDDLRNFSSREWLAKNMRWLDRCELKEKENGLGGHGRLEGGSPEGSEAPEADGEGSDRKKGKGEGRPGVVQEPSKDGGELEEEGGRPGGHLPDLPGEREDGGLHGPDDSPTEGGELHEARGDQAGAVGDNYSPRFSGIDPGATRRDIKPSDRNFTVETVFKDSLTDYEMGLIQTEGVTLEQINWLRYCLERNCKGDEVRRRREYPSYPEEAFEASGSDILDPSVLSKWTKEAEKEPPVAKGRMIARELRPGQLMVSFDSMDRTGKIEIYEYPDPHCRYVLGLDPSQGIEGGDWTVGVVLDVDSGDQVAEFRATIDPDLAVDQIEWLGIFYNNAFCIVETNGGYGWPYIRHLEERGTLPMYERQAYDRKTKQFLKRPGWDTTTKTRPLLITEMKETVRKELCRLRSIETLRECRTLWENETGKIEARPGKHDDGCFGWALALMARNDILGIERQAEEEERKTKDFVRILNGRSARAKRAEKNKISSRSIADTKHVHAQVGVRKDGRRSVF